MLERKLKQLLPMNIQMFAEDLPPDTPPVPPIVPPVVPIIKTVNKAVYDKVAKELAESKRLLKAKMTDEETAALAATELQTQLAEYKRKDAVNGYEKTLLSAGFNVADSTKAANSLIDGDIGVFGELLTTHMAGLTEKVKAEMLNITPTPDPGKVPPVTETPLDIMKKQFPE